MKSLIIIWILVVASGAAFFAAVDYGTAPAHVFADSSKDDGSCSTHARVGHCADKCADSTYILTGFDPTTGAAICVPPQPVQSVSDEVQYEGGGK